jgi:hypothetical protein
MAYWQWGGEDEAQFIAELLGEREPDPSPEIISPVVEREISKEDVENVVGEENTRRYYREEIPMVIQFILGNGSNDWAGIYRDLEENGWKGRSVSIVKDVVDHFRQQPLPQAEDEIATTPQQLIPPPHRNGEMDGRIGVISDKSGEATTVTVSFPYDAHFVGIIKRIPGRKWNSTRKRWEVPIEHINIIFLNFPKFELSEKAALFRISQ